MTWLPETDAALTAASTSGFGSVVVKMLPPWLPTWLRSFQSYVMVVPLTPVRTLLISADSCPEPGVGPPASGLVSCRSSILASVTAFA